MIFFAQALSPGPSQLGLTIEVEAANSRALVDGA
jgi:hypothetical protein